MSENLYTFAVTRLRSKELELLNGPFIDQLIGCKTHEDCRRLLGEKGWGKPEESDEEVLRAQRQKTWELMGELVPQIWQKGASFMKMIFLKYRALTSQFLLQISLQKNIN